MAFSLPLHGQLKRDKTGRLHFLSHLFLCTNLTHGCRSPYSITLEKATCEIRFADIVLCLLIIFAFETTLIHSIINRSAYTSREYRENTECAHHESFNHDRSITGSWSGWFRKHWQRQDNVKSNLFNIQQETSSRSWNMEHQAGFYPQCGNASLYIQIFYSMHSFFKHILMLPNIIIDKKHQGKAILQDKIL